MHADSFPGLLSSLIIGCRRFVEYWTRIGSEDNMTMCHYPSCRKESVLLDYSSDGGLVYELFDFSLKGLFIFKMA